MADDKCLFKDLGFSIIFFKQHYFKSGLEFEAKAGSIKP